MAIILTSAPFLMAAALAWSGQQSVEKYPKTTWVHIIEGDTSLLSLKRVQGELGLSQAEGNKARARVAKLVREQSDEVSKTVRSATTRGENNGEVRKVRREYSERIDAELLQQLTKEQFRRYKQICVQERGVMLFRDEEICLLFQLDDIQKASMNGALLLTRQRMSDLDREVEVKTLADRKRHQQLASAIRAEGVAACVEILKGWQKDLWQEINGPKFQLTP